MTDSQWTDRAADFLRGIGAKFTDSAAYGAALAKVAELLKQKECAK
ncbi:MAG: hypothetical protein ABFD65_13865 [Candidatus Polarisedimenticolia bacterium]